MMNIMRVQLFPTVFECGSTRTKDLLRVQAVGINQTDVRFPSWVTYDLYPKHVRMI